MLDILYTIIIYPLETIFEVVFVFAQLTFKETGLSVIFISLAISILCLPLYNVAEYWQQRERDTHKHMKAKIAKIRSAFKGDERYMILSAYYRQNHYHPIYAMRSTFGLLIQIPFFIAAYSYLSHNESLKGAAFLCISDLSIPDQLLFFGSYKLNVLPIIMTTLNVIAGFIYTKGSAAREKIQLYGMALIFLVLLYNSPSGLVLYWTCNNIFSLIKNVYSTIDSLVKNTVIRSIVSAGCLLMIYYVLVLHRGNTSVRHIFAVMLFFTGILPWIIPLLKTAIQKIPSIAYTTKKLFIFFILACLVLFIVTGVFIPSMLIASSPQEFSYIDGNSPFFFIINTCVQAFGFFVFWPACLFFLLSSKKTFTLTGLTVCFAALCNAFFFPGNYGLITLDMTFDNDVGHSLYEILINIAVLCIPACIIVFLFLREVFKIIAPLTALCGLVLMLLSIKNLAFIQAEYRKTSEFHLDKKAEMAVEPIFHFSKTGKNTLVLMLDRAMSSFVPFILEELPELKELYSGFVYYPNTLSFNGYTRLGAPPIFGGYEYIPTELNKRDTIPVVKKHNEALLLMPVIFSEAGYQVTVTDPPYPNYSVHDSIFDLADWEAASRTK